MRLSALPALLLPAVLLGASGTQRSAADRVIWSGGHRILRSAREIQLVDGAGRDSVPVALPPGTLWASWRADGVYALVQIPGKDGGREGLQVLVRAAQATAWEPYATLPEGLEDVRAALPTADGRLFLVPNGGFLQVPGSDEKDLRSRAPFLLLGRDDRGKWTRCETVDLDWGPPFLVPPGRDGKPDWSKRTHRYAFLSSARIEAPDLRDRLFELEDGWVLLDRHHGMAWIFNAKGAVQRHISVYDASKDEDLDLPLMAFPTSVLACESAPEDKLILAVRNDTAYFYSRRVWPVFADPRHPAPASSYLLQQAQSAKDFPDIAWRVLDTRTGEVHTMPPPQGLPSTFIFRPEDPNWHFAFAVTAEGQVVPPDAGDPPTKAPKDDESRNQDPPIPLPLHSGSKARKKE